MPSSRTHDTSTSHPRGLAQQYGGRKRRLSIIRVRKEPAKYATISKGFLSDVRLTYRAKGILAYLLSKPDDWQVRETDLIKQGPDGRHAVRRALQELHNAGYM